MQSGDCSFQWILNLLSISCQFLNLIAFDPSLFFKKMNVKKFSCVAYTTRKVFFHAAILWCSMDACHRVLLFMMYSK